MRLVALFSTVCAAAVLAGCSSPPKMAAEEFAPVLQLPTEPERPVTGSIYNGGKIDNWFGRKKDYRAGDIITAQVLAATRSTFFGVGSSRRRGAGRSPCGAQGMCGPHGSSWRA